MTAPVKRGRRGPRRALTEDEILDAALHLLDDGGPTAASVRGIAAKVGVAPNAVYTYFPDKAAVVKALVERLLGEVDHDVFADRTQPWRHRVEALALELRARLTAHPGAVPLMIGGPIDGPNALALNERLLELLADAGLTPVDAARAAYLLSVYVFGSIALEIADLHQPGPLPPESERIATRHLALAATPAEHYPRAAAAAATLAGYISTRAVPLGSPTRTRRHHHNDDRRPVTPPPSAAQNDPSPDSHNIEPERRRDQFRLGPGMTWLWPASGRAGAPPGCPHRRGAHASHSYCAARSPPPCAVPWPQSWLSGQLRLWVRTGAPAGALPPTTA